MQQGWIHLHRSLLEHWLHDEKPFCRFGAWVDLLLMANHDARKLSVDGELITIERGQLFTSSLSLSTRWGWSRGKVDRFLEMLERDMMIDTKRTSHGRLVNIVNYSVYQSVNDKNGQKTSTKRTVNEQSTDTRQTLDEQAADINKNVKNDKNDKNEKNERNISALRYFPEDDLLEKTFSDFRAMRKQIKAPMTDRAIELMVAKIKRYDPDIAVEMLKQSILNNWKDIYDLKDRRRQDQGEDLAKKWGIK